MQVHHPRRARGFTLLELLVIISSIALLVGLMMPALRGARTTALKTSCQNNLRQMSIALNTYAEAWRSYPAAIRYEERHGEPVKVAWDWVTSFADGKLIQPGPLWRYTDNPDKVMQCPAYHGPSHFEGDPYTGYNYNTSHIGAEAMAVDYGWDIVRRGVRPGAVRRPGDTAVFGCGGWSQGANKFMRDPTENHGHPLSMIYAGGQAFHYNGTTNVTYLDLHVDSVGDPRPGESATEPLLQTLGHPDNGFLSNDDNAYNPR